MSNNTGTPFANASQPDPAPVSGKYTFGHDRGVTSVHAIRKAATEAPHLLRNLPTLLKSLAAGSSSSEAPKIKVLDVGCGPGSITVDLISYLPAGSHITGIEPPFADESSGILSQARAHADEVLGRERSAAQLDFKRVDVYKLDEVFEEGSFDVVHAHQVLFHLHNPIKAIEQMWRVLKRGGILSLREGDWDTLAGEWPQTKPLSLIRFSHARSHSLSARPQSACTAPRHLRQQRRECASRTPAAQLGAPRNGRRFYRAHVPLARSDALLSCEPRRPRGHVGRQLPYALKPRVHARRRRLV